MAMPLTLTLKRENTCFLCNKGIVRESIIEHMIDSDCVPDQGNCDFSSYSDYTVSGGIVISKLVALRSHSTREKLTVICNSCLDEPKVKKMMEAKIRCS